MNRILVVVFLLISIQIYGQAGKDGNFNEKVFQSVYGEQAKSIWPLKNNEDYLIIIQQGKYILECKGADKKAYLLPKGVPVLQEYKIETVIRINKKSDNGGGAGLAFDILKDLKGGYLFEINARKEYRVSVLENGNYKYLSGTAKSKGWAKHKAIFKPGKDNILTMTQQKGKIQLLANGKEVFVADNTQSFSGLSGLILMGKVKAEASSFTLYSSGNESKVSSGGTDMLSVDSLKMGGDMKKMMDAYLLMRKENRELISKNENYKVEVDYCNKKIEELKAYIKDNLDIKLKDQVETLQKENERLEDENAALHEQNQDLAEFKKTIQNNKDGDQVLIYAEKYAAEQKKNEELLRRIAELEKEKKPVKPKKKKTTP